MAMFVWAFSDDHAIHISTTLMFCSYMWSMIIFSFFLIYDDVYVWTKLLHRTKVIKENWVKTFIFEAWHVWAYFFINHFHSFFFSSEPFFVILILILHCLVFFFFIVIHYHSLLVSFFTFDSHFFILRFPLRIWFLVCHSSFLFLLGLSLFSLLLLI
jgi:hypothetical protein